MTPGCEFQPSAASAATQCAKVLQRLRRGPASTVELRAILGLASSPAARVLTLRHAGHTIRTTRTTVGGAVVASYVLEGDAQ